MTEDEREKLIEDMAKASWAPLAAQPWDKALKIVKQQRLIEARAALAIAERRIREDCAEIAKGFEHNRDWVKGSLYGKIRQEVAALIAASIPEPKESKP